MRVWQKQQEGISFRWKLKGHILWPVVRRFKMATEKQHVVFMPTTQMCHYMNLELAGNSFCEAFVQGSWSVIGADFPELMSHGCSGHRHFSPHRIASRTTWGEGTPREFHKCLLAWFILSCVHFMLSSVPWKKNRIILIVIVPRLLDLFIRVEYRPHLCNILARLPYLKICWYKNLKELAVG